MSQITRVPWGLQDFLGNRNQGDNPSVFGEVVTPTLDMTPFFSINNEKLYSEGFGIITANATIDHTVPEGEVWILKSMGMYHKANSAGAGDGYTASYFAQELSNANIPSNQHGLRAPYVYETDGVTGDAIGEAQPVNDFIAWSGTVLKWRVGLMTSTAGNFSPAGFVRYLRLEI